METEDPVVVTVLPPTAPSPNGSQSTTCCTALPGAPSADSAEQAHGGSSGGFSACLPACCSAHASPHDPSGIFQPSYHCPCEGSQCSASGRRSCPRTNYSHVLVPCFGSSPGPVSNPVPWGRGSAEPVMTAEQVRPRSTHLTRDSPASKCPGGEGSSPGREARGGKELPSTKPPTALGC